MDRIQTFAPEPPPGLAGPGWDSLMRLAADLGDGDPARGLDSVVGIVRNVRTDSALATSTPWVRTLAASQVKGMTEAEVLAAFRIDGSQLPRLRDLVRAFSGGGDQALSPPITRDDLTEAKWLLRSMGMESGFAGLLARHVQP